MERIQYMDAGNFMDWRRFAASKMINIELYVSRQGGSDIANRAGDQKLKFVGSEEARSAAFALASVRRSNWTCSFPASSFHEWAFAV